MSSATVSFFEANVQCFLIFCQRWNLNSAVTTCSVIPTDARVPWFRWFSTKFVAVTQQTHQQLCQCAGSAASRCAGSPDFPRGLIHPLEESLFCIFVHESCRAGSFVCPFWKFACHQSFLAPIAVLVNIVSIRSNEGGLPKPLRSLSSSASSISSRFDGSQYLHLTHPSNC